jgi:hypothetical protein
VNPVRPGNLPAAASGPVARPIDPTRAAAQRAFFEAALGKATTASAPPPAATLSATPTTAAAQVQRVPDADAARPVKILRPGSVLDIRV